MSVYKRKDGRWVLDITIKRGGERVRVKKSAHARNRSEALEAERAERARLESGGLARPERVRFAAFAADFLSVYAATNNKNSERVSKEMILRRHLVPHFGELSSAELGHVASR